MSDDARLTALENKAQELEAMVALALRLLSLEKPVSALLQNHGAHQAEELAVHACSTTWLAAPNTASLGVGSQRAA